jgi:hypothetical protein
LSDYWVYGLLGGGWDVDWRLLMGLDFLLKEHLTS